MAQSLTDMIATSLLTMSEGKKDSETIWISHMIRNLRDNHFIMDTDMFEVCIKMMDEDTLKLLIRDEVMLQKISYSCMEIITRSSNVGFPEKNLFDLLVAWTTCKKQTNKKAFQQLFDNLRYTSMDEGFIIEHVMSYVYQNEGIFSVSFVRKIQEGMSETSKDMCRNEKIKHEHALKHGQVVLEILKLPDTDKTTKEKVNEVNSFLIRKDIRYLPDEIKEELSDTIWKKGDSFIRSLSWLYVVTLRNDHQTISTADILADYIIYKRNTAVVYKLDWTKVTDKAMIGVMESTRRWRLGSTTL